MLKQIGNDFFSVNIDEKTGWISSIENKKDEHKMNWCASDGNWGRIHKRNWNAFTREFGEIDGKKLELYSVEFFDNKAIVMYDSDEIFVTVTRYFAENRSFIENYTLKNKTNTIVCVNRDNFGIETPFNDRYDGADKCMVKRCNTHIWCGHSIAWVNALRMGPSDINLGLYLKRGAIDCYDQDKCTGGENRGIFILEPESMLLNPGEEYQIEWEIFWHKGTDDFLKKIEKFDGHIKIDALHYTIFENETIDFKIKADIPPVVTFENEIINAVSENDYYHVRFNPTKNGKYKFKVSVGDKFTWVNFMVKADFKTLLENRIKFIIKNQQCLDKKSNLYGAFLVYDNDYDSLYFDYANPDHNACRERMNIPLLLIKYLQIKNDPEVRAAIDIYIEFVFREFYEEKTGEVFNTIGKNRDQLRLYNAPGVMLIFCEMYFLTRDEKYLKHIMTLADNYYGIGGKKCYANGIAIAKVIKAFKMAGNKENTEKIMRHFQSHVDNIISIGLAYPPHEVKYEQTIVTPAVQHISDMGMLREDKEYYRKEAEKHLECLERFSGMQPDCFLNEIAIRFWDDYWFGKNRVVGDTLPHHLSVLTARAYLAYSKLSGKKEYKEKAEECLRNCMCLISDDGRGAAAHIYPYKLNGRRGEFFDPWSNDQDLVLYDALYFADEAGVFEI